MDGGVPNTTPPPVPPLWGSAFYTHQFVYSCTPMQLIVRNAKQSLTDLILFCTESAPQGPASRPRAPRGGRRLLSASFLP